MILYKLSSFHSHSRHFALQRRDGEKKWRYILFIKIWFQVNFDLTKINSQYHFPGFSWFPWEIKNQLSEKIPNWNQIWPVTYIELFRGKVFGKNVSATIPKGNMGYDQYTVPDDCSCRIYFCSYPLALANICPWVLVPFFQISLKNSGLKTTHNTLWDCCVHFFWQPFSK